MNFVKVKFLKNGQPSGRTYIYKTELELSPDDMVELPNGSRGIVIGGEIDTAWMEFFGIDNIKEIVVKVNFDKIKQVAGILADALNVMCFQDFGFILHKSEELAEKIDKIYGGE